MMVFQIAKNTFESKLSGVIDLVPLLNGVNVTAKSLTTSLNQLFTFKKALDFLETQPKPTFDELYCQTCLGPRPGD
jgi:hypothetical protein